MRKSVIGGQYTIPAAPSAGTTATSSASANTYGSYAEMVASTSAALFITGVIATLAAGTNAVSYVSVAIGVGAGASEVLQGTADGPVPFTAAASGSQVGIFIPLDPVIAVPISSRIAVKTADDVASGLAWKVKLIVIDQAKVVDAGIAELASNASGFLRNTSAAIQFVMEDGSGLPVTGLVDGDFTIRHESLDGTAFAALSGTITEVGNGLYTITLTAGEWDADLVTFYFAAPGALDRSFTIKTTTAS